MPYDRTSDSIKADGKMPNENFFNKARHFWDRQSLFGKHLLAMIVCFIGLPVIIVIAKLGFREFAMVMMFLEGVLLFWALGFWYAVKGAWRLFNTII
jgi:hypothetical protein